MQKTKGKTMDGKTSDGKAGAASERLEAMRGAMEQMGRAFIAAAGGER